MSANTNKAIISEAKAKSSMVYSGNNQYRIDTWSERHNAWYQGCNNRSYHGALSDLRESYIENVCSIVYDDCFAHDSYYVRDYSDWRQYARIIINNARNNKKGIFAEV